MVLALLLRVPTRRPRSWGVALLVAAVATGFLAQFSHDRLAAGWEGWWEEREEQVAEQLESALGTLLRNADRAAVEVAASLPDSVDRIQPLLRRSRLATGVSAMAVYDEAGELVAWDGVHQGPIPVAARSWGSPYLYGDGPLFGYLYTIAPVPETGGVVVAALLMRADLPATLGEGPGDFAREFRARWGEGIRITPADRAAGDAIWDLRWEGEVLFSVEILAPSRAARLSELRVAWGRVVASLLALAWVLLLLGGRGSGDEAVAATAALLGTAAVLPFGSLLGVPGVFSPVSFLLPGPWRITLGRLVALVLAGIVAAGILARPGARIPGRGALAFLAVGLGFPMGVILLRRGAAADFLAGPGEGWVVYQLALSLGLTALARGALLVGGGGGRPGSPVQAITGGVVAVALGMSVGAATRWMTPLPAWPVALWALPALLTLGGLGSRAAGRRGPLAWTLAAVLGTTAAVPWAWGHRVEARMEVAEARMERVGMRPDPYLEFLLHRVTLRADSLHYRGVGGLELLLGVWVGSGLAEGGYPVRLTLWSPGGVPREELRIGVSDPRPPVVDGLLPSVRRDGGTVVRRFELADAHYVAVIPLVDGSSVTAVVPPLRGLALPEPLGPLFASQVEVGEPLTLIPLLAEGGDDPGERLRWSPTGEGWRGETALSYPDGVFRARYALDFPPAGVALARGGLLLVLNLLLVWAAWGAARVSGPAASTRPGRREILAALGSFRARVTGVLFLFFLVPTLVFGVQAYRALEGASQRTAEALARRAVDDGASAFLEVQGELDLLSRRVRADLLLYEEGSLVAGSPRELADMGLFEGWLPVPARETLEGREEVVATAPYTWGRWSFVVAYRRLPSGGVLASSAPLQAGAAALRSREVADLLAFSLVLGAVLSLGLAVLAGRFLAHPIQVLQVASERVGSGNLRVRLPMNRTDEFGAVFGAFNRMVGRLRRARRDLVRTTRRTRAIVEEAATGVVALDAAGTVALANPRAADLLGVQLEPGEGIPGGSAARDGLVEWVRSTQRDGLQEAGTELLLGGRRIRVRARRIAREGTGGGVVLSLEDVTDELRAERILAWGEMAQQVAHEVKNPLTPIKLAVQHIRRAWEDGRADYGEILERNVDAILREIDRLAGIARSFSRFGAPRAAGEVPLSPVRLSSVVEELLALYGHGDGTVRFRGEVSPALPPVEARETEVKEVLVNLLENARAAASGGGEVVMEAEERGGGIELRVRDDGTGIPPELLPRVFEPHFSTRSTGAGLGLAIVKRLVESWGGTVIAEPGEMRGTVIRIGLRPWEPRGESASAPPSSGRAGGTGGLGSSSGAPSP